MGLAIDHLVVAARTLEEGAAWTEARLGVATTAGGQHALMGTHNRLLGLGAAVYLEVIAVDPAAPPPTRARWFSLDDARTRARLERGPWLIHWVARTDDIVSSAKASPVELGEILAMSRGDHHWRLTVASDGSLPADGVFPTLIQWDSRSPAGALSDSGCRLESLELSHPRAETIVTCLRSMGLSQRAPVVAVEGVPRQVARIRTPGGGLATLE